MDGDAEMGLSGKWTAWKLLSINLCTQRKSHFSTSAKSKTEATRRRQMHTQATYRHKDIVERYHSQFSRCCEKARASNPHSGDAAGNSWL